MQVKRIVTIEDAIAFAAERHRGQRDKAGEPYILHPLRVALRVRTDRERLAAVLHDVVEDTGVTLDELRERGLDESVVAAIEILTKRDGEDYRTFIERVAQDPIARAVKLADLADNLDPIAWPRCLPRSSGACARSTSPRASGCSLRGSRKCPRPKTSAASSTSHGNEPPRSGTRRSPS